MVGLIQKSGYIRAGKAGGYMKYIATREGVEKLHGAGPVTPAQQNLIQTLLQDFPDSRELFEYADYQAVPNFGNASAFISMALDSNLQNLGESDVYMKYIATRPRVEKRGDHGLFSDKAVDLNKTVSELSAYQGRVWTIVYSLRREDAARLGFDRAEAWRSLLQAKQTQLAEAMKIPADQFVWYAAFHNEGHHPHLHMMIWSKEPGQGYLNRAGVAAMRSTLTNVIFQDELTHVYEQKDISYKELTQAAKESMRELVKAMSSGICDNPQMEEMLGQLAQRLQAREGKKQYGYLPQSMKKLVDGIVDQMQTLPQVAACYEEWNHLRDEIEGYYKDTPRQRQPLSRQKEFHAVKNIVVREAVNLAQGGFTFEDGGMAGQDEAEDERVQQRLYRRLRNVVNDGQLSLRERDVAVEMLREMAQGGYAHAQHLLGKLYRDGGLLIADSEQARDWFAQAAAQNLSVSQYALGKLLLSDDAAVQAPAAGLHWLEAAAANGNHFAAYRLGREYLCGEIVAKDTDQAMDYLRQAAQSGNQYAQYTLGKLYAQGRDIPHDHDQVVYWLSQAAGQGHAYAPVFLERLEQNRSPDLMLAATRILRDVARVFRDNSLPPANPTGPRIDSKRRRQIMEKRLALGQRMDDSMEHMGY